MKHLYFVRHAEPDFSREDDRTRPLSSAGSADCSMVTSALHGIPINRFISSPYKRSVDTIRSSAEDHALGIATDERLRERERGNLPNSWEIIKKRWNDFAYHEDGGESLDMVQQRNAEAVLELLLNDNPLENIVIGTHGTALGTILNYFDPSCGFEEFKRIIDFMPYIVRLDFEGQKYIGKEDILVVAKPFIDRYKDSIITRSLEPTEIPEALRLVWDTFVEFEAPDYLPEGIIKFREYLDDKDFVDSLTFYGAFLHGLLAGILATRHDGCHVAMFFVRMEYQRSGVGRQLFEYIQKCCPQDKMTVNSSPYAVGIYAKLGFVPTAAEQTKDGIRYTPMEYAMFSNKKGGAV